MHFYQASIDEIGTTLISICKYTPRVYYIMHGYTYNSLDKVNVFAHTLH